MIHANDPDFGAAIALRLMGPDPQNWVPDRSGIDHNVMLVGGGQTGCALAYALRRAGIGKVSVIDAAEDETRLIAAAMPIMMPYALRARASSRSSGNNARIEP